MAQKKIIYDINGKVKETSTNYYDDSSNNVVFKNASFKTASLNLQNGIAYVNNTTISSSETPANNSTITWNSAANQWVIQPNSAIDVVSQNSLIPVSSDITGTFATSLKVKSLSNVNTGDALPVKNGGTGLKTSNLPEGESLLIGNGLSPFTFITASNLSNRSFLLSTTNGWSYLTQSSLDSSIQVDLYTASGDWTWNKPSNTKNIRIIAAGGGGGGASGANRSNAVAALGGTGGGGGQLIDTGILFLGNDNNSMLISVGKGGKGSVIPVTNSSGINAQNGYNTTVKIDPILELTASGGTGGLGGNINSAVVSSGGSGGSGGLNSIYDSIVYNVSKTSISGDTGVSNSTSTSLNSKARVASILQSGGPGGSLLANDYISNYSGGSGNFFLNQSPVVAKLFQFNNSLADEYYGSTWTNNGVTFNSNIKKFGTHSAYFNGSSYLMGPGNSFVAFYAGNSENSHLEFWINPVQVSSTATVFSILKANASAPYTPFHVKIISGGQVQFCFGSTGQSTITSDISISPGVWTHLAFSSEFQGGTNYYLRIFINGRLSAGGLITGDGWLSATVGRNAVSLNEYFTGYLDQFLCLRNIQIPQTSNFTPLPFPYTNTGGTTLSKNALSTPSGSLGEAYGISSIDFSIDSQANDLLFYSGGGGGASSATVSSSGGTGGNGAWGSGGGGGGASTNAVSNLNQIDVDTLSLNHFNFSEINPKDSAIYNSTVYVGSINKVVSTASMGSVSPINSIFSDGYFSSSAYPGFPLSGYHSYTIEPLSTTNFSMESWFYLENTSSNNSNATWKYCLLNAGRTSTATSGLQLWVNSTGELYFINRTSGAAGNGEYQLGTFMTGANLNKWHNIVMQLNATNAELYMNGELKSSVSVGTCTPSGEWGYGYSKDYPIYNFNGYAKELRILNRIQTPTEILNNYNAVMSGNQGSYSDHNGIQQGGNGGDGYVAVISYKN